MSNNHGENLAVWGILCIFAENNVNAMEEEKRKDEVCEARETREASGTSAPSVTRETRLTRGTSETRETSETRYFLEEDLGLVSEPIVMGKNGKPIPRVLNAEIRWEDLYFYQKSEVVYHLAFAFCDRFIHLYKDRTRDQVIQAARSCKQNIVEGLADGVTSTEMQMKLLNVARASLQELRQDFFDYIISRKLKFFGRAREARASETSEPRETRGTSETSETSKPSETRGTREARGSREPRYSQDPRYYDGDMQRYDAMLAYCRTHNKLADYEPFFDKWSDCEMCNYGITLCHMIDKMMTTFMEHLEKQFVTEGGIKERMYKARTGYRSTVDDRLHQLETERPQMEQEIARLRQQLADAQAKAEYWHGAYEDLKVRALNAYNRQKEEIERLRARES